jgi:hypothetical protein
MGENPLLIYLSVNQKDNESVVCINVFTPDNSLQYLLPNVTACVVSFQTLLLIVKTLYLVYPSNNTANPCQRAAVTFMKNVAVGMTKAVWEISITIVPPPNVVLFVQKLIFPVYKS